MQHTEEHIEEEGTPVAGILLVEVVGTLAPGTLVVGNLDLEEGNLNIQKKHKILPINIKY